MQEKLWKRSMIISAIFSAFNIFIIVTLLTVFRSFFKRNMITCIVLLIALTIGSIIIQRTLEMNADRKLILKLIEENKVALCNINSGTYYKTIKDSALNKYNLWKLECTVYNDNLETKKIEIIEKFSPKQLQIPTGYCYITYDEKEQYFIIPNAVISNYLNLKDKIEHYEKKVKSIKYLNVYYQNGLRLQTYKETLEEQ